jgi:hypothetical protein
MLLDASTLRDLEVVSPLTPIRTHALEPWGMTLLRQEQVLDLLGGAIDAGAS